MGIVWRNILRLLSVVLFAAVLLGVLTATGDVKWNSAPDAVTSATAQTVSAADMDGKWVVLLHRERYDAAGSTDGWKKFFSFDADVPLLMEDVTCCVADTDGAGLQIAEQYRARLPENQMTIRQEAGVLLLSKAEQGKFDVILLSEAAANAYSANTLYDKDSVLCIKMEA